MKRSKNSLTHGVYSQEIILPWEDAKAFDSLHQEIRRDLKPSGWLQEETVLDIAKEHWRRRRLAISYALPFYENQMTPELMEAAKDGVAGLAGYIANPSHRGAISISSEELLDNILRKKAAAGITTSPVKDDSNDGRDSKTNRITAEIVEQAYDLANLEKHLKLESMIDNRIKNLMGRLIGLKSYEVMYGQKEIEVLPPVEAPAMKSDEDLTKSNDFSTKESKKECSD